MGVQKQPRWNVAWFFFIKRISIWPFYMLHLHVYEYPYHKSKVLLFK